MMKRFRGIAIIGLVGVLLCLGACKSDSDEGGPRNITVTIRNMEAVRTVHIYFESDYAREQNKLVPGASMETVIQAQAVGWGLAVYVKDAADPGETHLEYTQVTVGEASWASGTAEIQWDGNQLNMINW